MKETAFREILEDLDKEFPQTRMLTHSDVSRYTGWSPKTVNSKIDFGERYNRYIHKIDLARQLAGGK